MNRNQEILDHLTKFQLSSRDQLAKLFFADNANPAKVCTAKMRVLRDRGLVEIQGEIEPYIYFIKPTYIKKRSAKLEHHLAIVDFYIELRPKVLAIEKNFGKDLPIPDLIIELNNQVYFVEIQRTKITNNRIQAKIKQYERLYIRGGYEQYSTTFPILWIYSLHNYTFKTNLSVKVGLN